MPSYYDIDSILAEEELIPCTTSFRFRNLAHLDPNYIPLTDLNRNWDDGSKKQEKELSLPEESKISMPLWSIRKWTTLGFITISLPKQFGRSARERIEADPVSVDLSSWERFFSSGILLINLIYKWQSAIMREMNRRNPRNESRIQQNIQQVVDEAEELRRILVNTYTGDRLIRTYDWSMTSFNDDVSVYTRHLTDIEHRLFKRGADASAAYHHWRRFGSRPIPVSSALLATHFFAPVSVEPRVALANMEQPSAKRIRVH